MDPVILTEKLESLHRCVRRIQDKTPPGIEALTQNPDIQDVLVLNLTRAVQLCIDIGSHVISKSDEAAPATMSDVFTILSRLGAITPATCESMKKATGFRNIAVHNYASLNWEIVLAICKKSTADFRGFAREIDSYSRRT